MRRPRGSLEAELEDVAQHLGQDIATVIRRRLEDAPAPPEPPPPPGVVDMIAWVRPRGGAAPTPPPVSTPPPVQGAGLQRRLERQGVPYQLARLCAGERPDRSLIQTPATSCIAGFLASAASSRRNVAILASEAHGTGKTTAACGVLNHGAGREVDPGLFLHATELVETSRFTGAGDELRRRIKRAAAVVLDDLGTEPSGDFFIRLVGQVIAYRIEAEGLTVLTTNLDPGQIRARYGELVYDRLREAAVWYDVPGESLRR